MLNSNVGTKYHGMKNITYQVININYYYRLCFETTIIWFFKWVYSAPKAERKTKEQRNANRDISVFNTITL